MRTERIFITGASSGIGFQSAIKLLSDGHHLIIPCRDINRSMETIEKIKDIFSTNEIERKISSPVADLSCLKSIDLMITNLIKEGKTIDSLVLNAGLQYTGSNNVMRSEDGVELTFAVNHLSHYFLTTKIIPLLRKAKRPRIIITSSEVHNPESGGGRIGQPADLGDLTGLKSRNNFSMIDGKSPFSADKAYKDSKVCNILFARELYRRFRTQISNLTVIAWAPGLVIPRTNDGFFRYSRKYNEFGQKMFAFFARDIFRISETVEDAGQILRDLVIEECFAKNNFTYYSNNIIGLSKHKLMESSISVEAANDDLARDLWCYSDKLITSIKS